MGRDDVDDLVFLLTTSLWNEVSMLNPALTPDLGVSTPLTLPCCMTMFSLYSAPLFHQPSLEEGISHVIAPSKVSSFFSSEFLWEFFIVFLEGLGWLRCSSMGVCEALCHIACKKGNTFLFYVYLNRMAFFSCFM